MQLPSRNQFLAGGLGFLLLVGCGRVGPPESDSAARSEPSDPTGSSPINSPDTEQERRYKEIYRSLEAEFNPPGLDTDVAIQLAGGTIRTGTLRGVTAEAIRMDFGVIEMTYPRQALSMASRVRLFKSDYLHTQTLDVLRRERVADASAARLDPSPSAPRATSPPTNDPTDLSVWQVRDHLLSTLKEPDSLEILHWSPVMETDGRYRVVCTYRAQAGSFGQVTERKVFHLDVAGTVVAVSPVRWDPGQDPPPAPGP